MTVLTELVDERKETRLQFIFRRQAVLPRRPNIVHAEVHFLMGAGLADGHTVQLAKVGRYPVRHDSRPDIPACPS